MSYCTSVRMLYNPGMSHYVYFALPTVSDFSEQFIPAVKQYYNNKPQALSNYACGHNYKLLDKDMVQSLNSDYEQGGHNLYGALLYVVAKQEEESLGVDFFERMQEALPKLMFKIVNKLSEQEGELEQYETDEPISFFGYITKSEVRELYDFMKDQTYPADLLPYTNFMIKSLEKASIKNVELISLHSWL